MAHDCRDKEDLAQVAFKHPLRIENQRLAEENTRLKRILLSHSLSWSPASQAFLAGKGSCTQRKTRSSISNPQKSGGLYLPAEIVLRVLKFAVQSQHPILDPLSPSNPAHLTEAEKDRGNQVAINFLATCKAIHVEGTKLFWNSNTFVFTTPQALTTFGALSAGFREDIRHITIRVIARYYDDQKARKLKLPAAYHTELKRDMKLKVAQRPKEAALVRGGLRSYAWTQVVDFLQALRGPFDINFRHKDKPRPNLLPNLTSMRIDLVNFTDRYLPPSGAELHDVASHEFGCTLNELQITGMPDGDIGSRANAELSGMLKDEGLFMDGIAAYWAPSAGQLQPLRGYYWAPRVVRAAMEDFSDDEDDLLGFDGEMTAWYNQGHSHKGFAPPAPPEEGCPETCMPLDEYIWKRVPISRDEESRDWVLFDRRTGREHFDEDEDLCPCCGTWHESVYGAGDLDLSLD
ncbi:uncharacterized protein F5Z01DRAFT_155666 [Emericellopsis atlantica]|uniref:Uncharacterized protein n=1 Tax=Emericellopsis atlantica TaxID=2614577 RepID=A0A9P8CNK9_9HYPO|nr:uncharacterized protein F5Z01DRAFT_155666 [Emericellopsis atlantica]KAG9253185.1 hypothetical protein F5Z01DRAFT_155666 [Emericellopsis atlantica]